MPSKSTVGQQRLIDKNSIKENSKNEITVVHPSNVLIGDFEDGVHGWSGDGTSTLTTDTSKVYDGSQSLYGSEGAGGSYFEKYKAVDLTPYEKVTFHVYPGTNTNYAGAGINSSGVVRVRDADTRSAHTDDGSSGISQGTWNTITFDVSDLTGEYTLITGGYDSDGNGIWTDYVYGVVPNQDILDSEVTL